MKTFLKISKKGMKEINKHLQKVPLYQHQPIISDRAYLFPNTTVVGETVFFSNTYLGSNSVVRGDMNLVLINENVFIYENCSLNTVHRILNSHEKATLEINEKTIIGPGCSLTPCRIDEKVHIGANSVIGEGAHIKKGSIIGPNSVVPPNRVIPEFEIWSGNPVRFVRKVSKEVKTAHVYKIASIYKEMRKFPYEERPNSGCYLEYEKLLD